MNPCDDFDRHLADALDGGAPLPEPLRAHVAACPACRATRDALDRIREMEAATLPERDDADWERFDRGLDRRLATAGAPPAPARRRRMGPWLVAAAGLAAAVLLRSDAVAPGEEMVLATSPAPPAVEEAALEEVSVELGLLALDADVLVEPATGDSAAAFVVDAENEILPWEDPMDDLARELSRDLDEQAQRDLAAAIQEAFPG